MKLKDECMERLTIKSIAQRLHLSIFTVSSIVARGKVNSSVNSATKGALYLIDSDFFDQFRDYIYLRLDKYSQSKVQRKKWLIVLDKLKEWETIYNTQLV